jgi:membrane-associated phospholipid phosphatase
MTKERKQPVRRGPLLRVLALGLGFNIGATWALGKLVQGGLHDPAAAVDHTLTAQMRRTRGGKADQAARLFSGLGEPNTLYPLVGLTGAWWLARRRHGDAATLALALLGSAGIDKAMKTLIDRPRPRRIWRRQQSSGSSFPSQHLAMSVATYSTLIYLITRRRGHEKRRRRGRLLWASVLALIGLIGWSRVYEGVHHPTDVLGGAMSGTLWFATCAAAAHTLAPRGSGQDRRARRAPAPGSP